MALSLDLSLRNAVAAAVLTILTSSLGILTTASKVGGSYLYNPATVPLLAELLKFFLSAYFLYQQRIALAQTGDKLPALSTSSAPLYIFPSILYWAHNNVQFYTLKYVDPATYQILGNLKIITTGLLFRVCLRRRLSYLQWMALVLLLIGATTSQLQTKCDSDQQFTAPVQGYLLAALSAFMSGVGAVYSEWVMKRSGDSLHWQNMQLYAFGIVVNGVGVALSETHTAHAALLHNYTPLVAVIVLNLALSGLLVSWIFKFADSILKVYSTSLAMVLSMVLSVYLFRLRLTLQLLLGVATAIISLLLYYLPPVPLTSPKNGNAACTV